METLTLTLAITLTLTLTSTAKAMEDAVNIAAQPPLPGAAAHSSLVSGRVRVRDRVRGRGRLGLGVGVGLGVGLGLGLGLALGLGLGSPGELLDVEQPRGELRDVGKLMRTLWLWGPGSWVRLPVCSHEPA